MNARLRTLWQARSPRERRLVAIAAAISAPLLVAAWLVAAHEALPPLRDAVAATRVQAANLDRQALEYAQLRASPTKAIAATPLRQVVEGRLAGTGLARGLARLDAPDGDRVVIVFGAVAFADWLEWAGSLQAQHIQLESCRIDALGTPGMVSVTATLVRPRQP